MGLGLTLSTRTFPPEPLAAIERFVDTHFRELVEHSHRDDTGYGIQLHPAAENVRFTFADGVLTVSAKTSTVGPGYHACVCELLRKLDYDWRANKDEGDETGYYTSGDREALEGEMLAWLQGLAGKVLERRAENVTDLMVSLPIGDVYEFDEAIATPMGPRDVAWLERVRKDPRAGIDIFPWWEPGRGARFLRERAIARMWTDVRWRAPIDEQEKSLLEKIAADLAAARKLDPTLDLPWAEWAEIARHLGQADPTGGREAARSPAIGYRRRPVRTLLTGHWTVRIPGSMATSCDEKGTWRGHTPGRTIWMSSFSIGDPKAPTLTAAATLGKPDTSGEAIEIAGLPDAYAHRARIETTGEGFGQLSFRIALPHRLAFFTIVFEDAGDLEWAKSTAASVSNQVAR